MRSEKRERGPNVGMWPFGATDVTLTPPPQTSMTPTIRRTAILVAAILTTTLAACTNPMAPASGHGTHTPSERPNLDTAYQGSVG